MATKVERDRTKDFVNIYRDGAGKFRWQRKSRNGLIVADSGQGYDTEKFAEEMATGVNSNVSDFRFIPWDDQDKQIDHVE